MACIPLLPAWARPWGQWSGAGSMIPGDTPPRLCSRAWSCWRVWPGSRCSSGDNPWAGHRTTASAMPCHHEALWRYASEEHGRAITARQWDRPQDSTLPHVCLVVPGEGSPCAAAPSVLRLNYGRRGTMEEAAGTLTFWGVRGSIPAPGLHTITFGGNTSCVSVEYGEHVIIFDAGSGLRQLGLYLMARETPPITGSLFLTHTHWDHIQGLPFFTPAFTPENHFVIYGVARPRYPLVELMEDQIQHPFFPVEMQDLFRAQIDFRELASGDTVEINPQIRVDRKSVV